MVVGGGIVKGSWMTAILFGVSSAMLGVSGFESSSQVYLMSTATTDFTRSARFTRCNRVSVCSDAFNSVFMLFFVVRSGAVWYGMVWYGMVWYGIVWYGMVW